MKFLEICKRKKKKTLVHVTLEHEFHPRVLCTNDSSSSFSAIHFSRESGIPDGLTGGK